MKKEKIEISIVLLTYNQENIVLETLESIKYQIIRYGNGYTFQIIIADDASKDNTYLFENRWLKDNKELFEEIVLLDSDFNRGTCKNVARAFRCIKGTHLISLAGDDLLPNNNIIQLVVNCGEREIIGGMPISFQDYILDMNEKSYYSIAKSCFLTPSSIIYQSKYSCPILNGFIIGRGLITEEVLKFSEKFDLLDDQARFLKMFEDLKEFSYQYVNQPLLLYRKSKSQITNKAGQFNERIKKDKEKQAEYALSVEKKLIIRNAIKFERMRVVVPDKFEKRWKYGYVLGYFELLKYKLSKRVLIEHIKGVFEILNRNKTQEYIYAIKNAAQTIRLDIMENNDEY